MHPRCIKAKIFQGLDRVNLHQGSTMNSLWSLQHLKISASILQYFCDCFPWNTTFRNSVFLQKQTLIKLLGKMPESILVLKLHSKSISSLSSFYFKLFVWHPDVKRPKIFRCFTPWTPTRALPWSCCKAYSTLRPSPAFYNMWKLSLWLKTNIS